MFARFAGRLCHGSTSTGTTCALKTLRTVILATVVVNICGCATHAGNGAAVGGLLGSMAGLAVGSATGHPEGGALIGGALGAVTGATVGASMDEQERRTEARIAAAEARLQGQLTAQQTLLMDVVNMTRNGVSDDTIIAHVRSVGLPARLSSDEIIYLKNQGVSDRVIQAMLSMTPRPVTVVTPRTVIYERPAVIYDPGPVYVVEPVPPPVRFSFGYYYIGGRRHCCP